MPLLQRELSNIAGKARLSSAVDNVDKMIALLLEAREHIALGRLALPPREKPLLTGVIVIASDPHSTSLALTKLQNPIREGFDAINDNLRAVSKVQKEFGRSLDKVGRGRHYRPAAAC